MPTVLLERADGGDDDRILTDDRGEFRGGEFFEPHAATIVRRAIKSSEPDAGLLTLFKVNSGRQAFSGPWSSAPRARGRPLLRWEGLDVRRVRRDATRVGSDPPPVDRPGRPRLPDVPRAEPTRGAAPRGGDGLPARA